ncbi:hypothetical protein [Nocardia sp. BMG51109]|uniref:hypothetical protein n=1 Tax=Nocardia sp. BMG51109 TaxID=1056816 RepID=UPI000466AC50|nr:hypothetical protein [Nocardia sp. BMG51109]
MSDLGPLRPEHATDEWRLDGDENSWWLSKHADSLVAKIRPTTPTTCAWGIYTTDGRMIREASVTCVDVAKQAVDEWGQDA